MQHVREVPVLIDDAGTRQRVQHAVDELDTAEATRFAINQGVAPPSGEVGWMLCQRFEADGSEGPLLWILVTETQA